MASIPTVVSFEGKKASRFRAAIEEYHASPNGLLLDVYFSDGSAFTFHAQWLYDSRCDDGSSRDATTAFCQTKPNASIASVNYTDQGAASTLKVCWNGGGTSYFPVLWLKAKAPLVARNHPTPAGNEGKLHLAAQQPGWRSNVKIPEVRWDDICSQTTPAHLREAAIARVLDLLLADSDMGIVRVTGIPPANLEDESKTEKTQVTHVLKQLFGSVFVHPRRDADTSFNVFSAAGENPNPVALFSYNNNQQDTQVLLPHSDHAHYQHPAQVMGFATPQGVSVNTFVSALAVIHTMRQKAPELLQHLLTDPVAIGRCAHYYTPPLMQAAVDTIITLQPGSTHAVKRVRWHPHFSGSCLSAFDKFHKAREAHQRFQEIMRDSDHQLLLRMEPGDMYLWNNFLVLHGRESIVESPRLGVGQTVPEEVVVQRYRDVKIAQLLPYVDRKWLVHVPTAQLEAMVASARQP